MQTAYKICFCGFVALCAVVQLGPVLDISDALVFIICVPNVLGLCILGPMVKRKMNSYFARMQSGEIKNFRLADAESD